MVRTRDRLTSFFKVFFMDNQKNEETVTMMDAVLGSPARLRSHTKLSSCSSFSNPTLPPGLYTKNIFKFKFKFKLFIFGAKQVNYTILKYNMSTQIYYLSPQTKVNADELLLKVVTFSYLSHF